MYKFSGLDIIFSSYVSMIFSCAVEPEGVDGVKFDSHWSFYVRTIFLITL